MNIFLLLFGEYRCSSCRSAWCSSRWCNRARLAGRAYPWLQCWSSTACRTLERAQRGNNPGLYRKNNLSDSWTHLPSHTDRSWLQLRLTKLLLSLLRLGHALRLWLMKIQILKPIFIMKKNHHDMSDIGLAFNFENLRCMRMHRRYSRCTL